MRPPRAVTSERDLLGEVAVSDLLRDLRHEVWRQDEKHGPEFNGASALGKIRLGVACVEDEARETRKAWRKDKRAFLRGEHDWLRTREEALQTAAVALRLVRQIDAIERAEQERSDG